MASKMYLTHACGEKILIANQKHNLESWEAVKQLDKKLGDWLQDLHLKGESDDSFDLAFDHNKKHGYHF